MKKTTSLLVVILAIAAASASTAYSKGKEYPVTKTSPDAKKSSYDIQFLDSMIEHHRQGVEMAQKAVDRSQTQEIKKKAQSMMTDLKGDISKMKSIRDDIQENAPESINMDMEGMKQVDMKELDTVSAKNFDEKFLKMSIAHEEGGLEMSKEASKRAKNQAIKDEARELTNKQIGEIAELKEMLKNQ
ncbi:MAG: DUF305 domain-containing protein [Pseudomonadota bacterium]